MAAEGEKVFGRFDSQGVRSDSVRADYMVVEGATVKLYCNREGNATEDGLVAVINTETGFAVMDIEQKI